LQEQPNEQLQLDLDTSVHCFVYVGDDVRSERHARVGERFTDALAFDAVRYLRQVVLVSWSGDGVDAVGLLRRGIRVADLKRQVTLEHLHHCGRVSFASLTELVPAERRESLAGAFASSAGSQLGAEDSAALRTAVLRLGGEIAEAWRDVEALIRHQPPVLWREDREPVVAYERDAVGLSLDLAGFDRRALLSRWRGSGEEPFIHGIAGFRTNENAILTSDMRVFGDWQEISHGLTGWVAFEKGGRRLTIANVNQTDIERSLGCDLLYHVHEHNAYVLVQYKRLRRDSQGRWEYRPSRDAGFEAQLARMAAIAQGANSATPDAYRLGEGFCFVKFCEPVTQDPMSGDLSAGMYLPIEYIECLRTSGSVLGPRGGDVIRHDNVRRWLTNTLFTRLVERTWVGTRDLATKDIAKVIREALDAGESVVVAENTPA